jgi:hypothetical protein
MTINDVSIQQHAEAAKAKTRILEARVAGRTLEEIDFYPERPAREETKGFRAIKKDMIVKRDMPCHICGVTHSILTDPVKRKDHKLNPYGATQMELHHQHTECQLALAISLDKFNAKVYPWLHRVHPDKYPNPLTQQELLDWVDHGEENMQALCDICHRHKYLGVHAITGPIWNPQDLYNDDFQEFVQEKLAAIRE